jgi:uncharacterized membrane protein YcaP (DUF421 family)
MDAEELLLTAIRTVAVYALMLTVIRLLGKREVGNFTAFDLIVALMLGELVDEVIYGDIPFLQGATAVVVLAGLQYATSWMSFASKRADRLLDGVPTVVIRDGQLQAEGMRKERMNKDEVMGLLREREIEDLREVKIALVEVGGSLSVIRQDWANPLQKSDIDDEARKARDRVIGDQEEPPLEKNTIAREFVS